jgi:PHD/YefM family antitoxin component YafN of YafNO toxin-antitoxin module
MVNKLGKHAMNQLSANELKTRGVAAIEKALSEHSEAIVSVRGKQRYVVMEMSQYLHLRECELESALMEARASVAAGRVIRESAEAHLARLEAEG